MAEMLTVILLVDNSRAVTGAFNALRHTIGPLWGRYRFAWVVPAGSTACPLLEANGYLVHELPFVEISRRKLDLLRYPFMLLLNGWRLCQLAWHNGASSIHLTDAASRIRDQAEWVATLAELLANANQRAHLGQQAYERASDFSYSSTFQRWRQLIDATLAS